MELNELTLKLKERLVHNLTHNSQNIDKEYLVIGEKSYSRRVLAEEVKAETVLGIYLLTRMVSLAIDISSRNKQP